MYAKGPFVRFYLSVRPSNDPTRDLIVVYHFISFVLVRLSLRLRQGCTAGVGSALSLRSYWGLGGGSDNSDPRF